MDSPPTHHWRKINDEKALALVGLRSKQPHEVFRDMASLFVCGHIANLRELFVSEFDVRGMVDGFAGGIV